MLVNLIVTPLVLTTFLKCCHSISDEVITELVERVEFLETREKHLIGIFSDEISALKHEIHLQNVKIAKLTQNGTQAGPARTNEQNETAVNRTIRQPEKKRRLLGTQTQIAFHATTDKLVVSHLDIGQTIVLDVVLLDLGNGYHPNHGVFISPLNGVYLFSASVMTTPNTRFEVRVNLLKNGIALGRAYACGNGGSENQGSITVVTQLNAADEVWLAIDYPATEAYYYGYRSTSFVGYRLSPL